MLKIDLETCKKLLNDEFLTNSVSFHAQQTVEKCFKAIFEENELKVLRIHNLMRLYNKINKFIDYTVDEDILEKTDTVYTETRYPGDMGMLPDGKPTIKEAKEMYEFAKQIYYDTIKMFNDAEPEEKK